MNRSRLMIAMAVSLAGWFAASARADVNLELRPVTDWVRVGDVAEIGLYAVSDSTEDQVVRGMQVILQWDPVHLILDEAQPHVDNGPYDWFLSGFYDDSGADGLNETFEDGDAYYQAGANFSGPAYATPEGLLVTTFRFIALAQTSGTEVQMPLTLGGVTSTQVFGQEVGQDVLGTLTPASIEIPPVLSFTAGDCACGSQIVELRLSEMGESVSAMQVLVQFDPAVWVPQEVLPGDGIGSPWDSAIEVTQDVDGDVLTYALALLGTGTSENAVVARIQFDVLADADTTLTILPQQGAIQTKLTAYPQLTTIIPALDDLEIVVTGSKGDVNDDGVANGNDIQAFTQTLLDPGGATPWEIAQSDMDGDGDVLADTDLPLFVHFLLTGECECP